jgi:hypothetical protein
MKILLIILAFFLPLSLFANEPLKAPKFLNQYIGSPKKVGEGRLKWMWLHVYDVSLYAENAKFSKNKPFALQIRYLRHINGEDIANSSIDEIKRQENISDEKLETWHNQMLEIFPDVKNGSEIVGIATKQGHSVFYFDNEKIGEIKDRQFTKLFFNIWFGEKTKKPTLKNNLLGNY